MINGSVILLIWALGMTWAPTTLEQDVCFAQAIATGKLTNIRHRYMSVAFENTTRPWKWYYDVGNIVGGRVLKSDGNLDDKNYPTSVIFDSDEQAANPYGSIPTPRKEGDEGIWFLARDVFSGSYLILKPKSPMSMNQEDEIVSLVKEGKCEK